MSSRRFSVVFAVIGVLLFAGSCKSPQESGKSALVAAMTDDVDRLKRLDVEGADLNAQYPERLDWTPLIAAVYFQSTNATAYLIERGVDVSVRDSSLQTALTRAIAADDTNTVKLLFQKAPQTLLEREDWGVVWGTVQWTDRPKEWMDLLTSLLGMNVNRTLDSK